MELNNAIKAAMVLALVLALVALFCFAVEHNRARAAAEQNQQQ